MKLSAGRAILGIGTTVVLVAAVAGVVVVGTPAESRLERFDARRVEDLRSIEAAIDFTFRADRALPQSLDSLRDVRRDLVRTVDPATSEPYSYQVVDEDSYRLCATFDRESRGMGSSGPVGFWEHPAGRHCFELEAEG